MGGEAARLVRLPGRPFDSRGNVGAREMIAARFGGIQDSAYSLALFFVSGRQHGSQAICCGDVLSRKWC